jgi:16S rRNA (cytosine967-C5)-methyltransferase
VIADAAKSLPFRCSFDAVLADVPCSGLGTLRRNPEIKWNFKPAKLISLKQVQKQILHNVSQAVRAGGRLLYSTCSTEPEENEEIIGDFLRLHPAFSLERPTYPSGIDLWVGEDRMMRTFPSPRLWDGFFAALLVRRT